LCSREIDQPPCLLCGKPMRLLSIEEEYPGYSASIASGGAFLILGVLMPLLCVVLTIAWLWHRGIIRFRL
jgi:hypothetical protein